MFFQSFVLFTALLPVVLTVTPYTSCMSGGKIEVSDFNINDCQSTPCEVNTTAGETLRVSLNLTALQQIGAGNALPLIQLEVFFDSNVLGFISQGTTTNPLCDDKFQCPLQPGKIYPLTRVVKLRKLIRANYKLRLSILEGASVKMCIDVDIRVV